MTVRIPQSQLAGLGFDLVEAIEAFRQAKLAHRFTEGVPAPTAPAIVEDCIRRVQVDGKPDDYVADYEIVDDTPPLRARKDMLIAQVTRREAERLAEIVPLGKRRLMNMRASDALSKEDKDRTEEEKAFLAAREPLVAEWQKVERFAAELHADIEDLTEETIAAWKMPEFPK